MKTLFLSIWKKRRHVSEISGEVIPSPSSMHFHHILEKNKYPEAMYDEENVILLSSVEHANVHLDMYRYEEINEKRNQLIKKYEIL